MTRISRLLAAARRLMAAVAACLMLNFGAAAQLPVIPTPARASTARGSLAVGSATAVSARGGAYADALADFVQDGSHSVGRFWNGYNRIEDVAAFPEPVMHLAKGYEEQILGLQMSLWTERVADARRLDFMTFPRLAGVAEAAWTPAASKEPTLFMRKLPRFLRWLDTKDIYYYNPFDPKSTPEPSAPDKADLLKNG